MSPIDMPPPLWVPPRPAIIRAANEEDIKRALLMGTFAASAVRGLRSTGKRYQTPSYANTGGTGDRTGFITVTSGLTPSSGTVSNAVDGATSLGGSDSFVFPNVAWANTSILRFDWGAGVKVLITEMRMVGQVSGYNSGTFKFRASDDASSWTDYGSAVTWISDAGPNVYTGLSTNVTAYRYYELYGVSGNANNNVWCCEWEFKIGNLV